MLVAEFGGDVVVGLPAVAFGGGGLGFAQG